MGKKLIKIGEKSYLIDVETKELEEVEVVEEETPEVEEETEEETPEVETEKTEEEETEEETPATEDAIKKIATEVVAKLGIDKLTKSVDVLEKAAITSNGTEDKKISALLDLETLMKKSVSEMTTEEKVVGFYQAMIQNNSTVLKALSEGTAADGGYLFPKLIGELKMGELLEHPYGTISSQALPVMA